MLNLQSDVVGLMDSNANIVVSYQYDPWGAVLSCTGSEASTIGAMNPLRYRGYYYDTETGFYYLQSRYYDPALGRFINADTYSTTDTQGFLSYNMFAYCENDPVMYKDPEGDIAVVAVLLPVLGGAIFGAIAGAGVGAAAAKMNGENGVYGAISGAIGGGISGAGVGLAALCPAMGSPIVMSTGMAGSIAEDYTKALLNNEHAYAEDVAFNAALAGSMSVIGLKNGKMMTKMLGLDSSVAKDATKKSSSAVKISKKIVKAITSAKGISVFYHGHSSIRNTILQKAIGRIHKEYRWRSYRRH